MKANPFDAARFVPGALRWIPEDALAPLAEAVCVPHGRFQILGPHGSGKSTMLVHLERLVRWNAVRLRGSQGLRGLSLPLAPVVILVDEAEELGVVRFAIVRALARVRRASLVVTAHRDLGFVTLAERRVEPEIVHALCSELARGGAAPSLDDVRSLLTRHDGNVREVFFELYDRARTTAARG